MCHGKLLNLPFVSYMFAYAGTDATLMQVFLLMTMECFLFVSLKTYSLVLNSVYNCGGKK